MEAGGASGGQREAVQRSVAKSCKTLREKELQISHLTQCLKDKEEREVTERSWKEELCPRAGELLLPVKKSQTQTTSQPESKSSKNCLQERSREELAEKDGSLETMVKQLEEEKKKLEQRNKNLEMEKTELEDKTAKPKQS